MSNQDQILDSPQFVTQNSTQNFDSKDNNETLPEIFYMTSSSRNCVIAYSIIFIIAATGNLSVFISVLRQLRRLKWRITILILHLSVADLIVTFFMIPMEIFWRLSVQWYGGNILCKICQFMRAFGLYLSSMILICISLDRFFAIIFPLKMVAASGRVKLSLVVAWIMAALCALPQVFVFSVKTHPNYPDFQQCVSLNYFSSQENEVLYNIFSLMALYFVPLLVIIFCYSMILYKISQKSKEHLQGVSTLTGRISRFSTRSSASQLKLKNGVIPANGSPVDGTNRLKFILRNRDSAANFTRAKFRTLKLTVIIILVFVLCWSPYCIVVLWYMFDRDSAEKLDARIQDGLFIMAVAQSCFNPLVYGSYARENKGPCSRLIKCGFRSPRRSTDNIPVTSII